MVSTEGESSDRGLTTKEKLTEIISQRGHGRHLVRCLLPFSTGLQQEFDPQSLLCFGSFRLLGSLSMIVGLEEGTVEREECMCATGRERSVMP